ncbi:MAG: hypothetical protein QOH37_343 [Nocardioidaceae bacterium]|nr:hypothetical protein [Nocardioidaceae bacterium]
MTTLRVDLDLATTDPSASARVHVGYALSGSRVAGVVVHGTGRVEVLSLEVGQWRRELEGRLRLPAPARVRPAPACLLELPWDLLVGTAAALSGRRPEVYDELVARDAGAVRADGTVLDLGATHQQLRRLHHGVQARLQAVGSGGRRGRLRVGLASWLLFGDGWRELAPYAGRSALGRPRAMVRVESRRPADLAALVARWAVEVRA